MGFNLPNITGVVGSITAGTALVNAVLVTLEGVETDVKNPQGTTFVFNYRDEDSTDLKSDITDQYSETNTALQDQISLKPIRTTIHGFIGELNDQATGVAAEIQLIASKLTVLAPYVPALTTAALAAFNEAQQIYNAASAVKATISQALQLVGGPTQLSQQALAYNYFKTGWLNRSLFQVTTPWEVLNNMAIEDLHAVQSGESNTYSDFRITFKQINFADTTSSLLPIAQGRRQTQLAQQTSQGIQNSIPVGALIPGGNNTSVLLQA